MNKKLLIAAIALVIVAGVVWIVAKPKSSTPTGIGAGPVERTHSVKCENPQCNFTDAQMPETSFKVLEANAEGQKKCPACGEFSLQELNAPSTP